LKHIVILGAGTAGTIMAHHLSRSFEKDEWQITIIDQYKTHYYQPGFLFVPFGLYTEKDVIRQKSSLIPGNVRFIQEAAELIDKDKNQIILKNGSKIDYDILVIATGCRIAPEEIDGLEGDGWHKNSFDFYTLTGALALHDALKNFKGGRLVIHIAEMPIKCPVAPLEFTFLADSFLREKGIRKEVEISYVTPLTGAFTKQNCSKVLGYLLVEKEIRLVPEFAIQRVDQENRKLVSYDEKTVDYDLLVTVPTNKGDEIIERSGFGDELNFVPTDKNTLQSKVKDNILLSGMHLIFPLQRPGR
jgi:sulfide:quinone oxidoreductase